MPAGAFMLDVFADTATHEVIGATADGATLPGGQNVPEQVAPGWRWGFRYAAPSGDGVDLTVRLKGSGPPRIRVVTTGVGLPSDVGAPDLAANLSWTPWPILPSVTYVVRTFTI